MISILTNKRKRPKFLVYDLEWIPRKMQIRLCGVYDGARYRWYRTVDDFISDELTHCNRGKWFYAHAGGLADFQFVIERLSALGYHVQGSTSGSSMIIAHVSRRKWDGVKDEWVPGQDVWHFVDSYWLLRDSLRNIGKWLGLAKGNAEESVDWYETAPLLELRDYNERDCQILYKGIAMFEEILYELGGQLRMTQASCAMDLFRRRFLSRNIETSKIVNELSREAYFASRVEVFSREATDARYYDINSSFPFAMTHEMPGELTRIGHGKLPRLEARPFIADIEIDTGTHQYPPLPLRYEGRLFFPQGKWRGRYSNIDVQLLLTMGGRVEKVHEVMEFEANWDLKDYVETLYGRRIKSDGFLKLAYKYLLNSLYGKFGECEVKSEIIVNPMEVQPEWRMTTPGIYATDKIAEVPHMHVPISVQVTAIARKTLYDYMMRSGTVHYCDTDGFSTHGEHTDENSLGGLKLEKYIRKGRFVQAKVYDIEGTDANGVPLSTPGDPDGIGHLVKAKGFSRMTLAKFERLLNYEEIEYVRMARIRENVRLGNLTPSESVMTKRLNKEAISKRCFDKVGNSRPWTVAELEEMK